MLTEAIRAYIQSRRLACIATVSPDGQPDVAPVAFAFDGDYFYVGGRSMTRTLKYLNVKAGSLKVALSFDDLETGKPRGVRVHGTAELVAPYGKLTGAQNLKITPTAYWSWGVESSPYEVKQGAMTR